MIRLTPGIIWDIIQVRYLWRSVLSMGLDMGKYCPTSLASRGSRGKLKIYSVIDSIIGGQILSAVADGKLTIVVGIIIVAVVSLIVTFFGMAVFHVYERCVVPLRSLSNRFLNLSTHQDGHGSHWLLFFSCWSDLRAPSSIRACNRKETASRSMRTGYHSFLSACRLRFHGFLIQETILFITPSPLLGGKLS